MVQYLRFKFSTITPYRQSRLTAVEQITFHDTKIKHFTLTNIDHSRLTKIPFPTLYAQRSRTSFFNTFMKKNSLFWPINVEISLTENEAPVMTWSLVFVLMLISIFIDQNPISFSRMCWRRMFCFSVHSPWEKNLKSFPFKMVPSWKQCSV